MHVLPFVSSLQNLPPHLAGTYPPPYLPWVFRYLAWDVNRHLHRSRQGTRSSTCVSSSVSHA